MLTQARAASGRKRRGHAARPGLDPFGSHMPSTYLASASPGHGGIVMQMNFRSSSSIPVLERRADWNVSRRTRNELRDTAGYAIISPYLTAPLQ